MNDQNPTSGVMAPPVAETTAVVTTKAEVEAMSADAISVEVDPEWTREALQSTNHDPVPLLPAHEDVIRLALSGIESDQISVKDPDALAQWQALVDGAMLTGVKPSVVGGGFLNVPKGRYTNKPKHRGVPLQPQRARVSGGMGDGPETMIGSKAIADLMTMRGIGTRSSAFMPHTGVRITFTPPSDPSLMELYRQMTEDSAKLGRETFGLTMSNQMAYQTEAVVNFALSHVNSCSLAASEYPAAERPFFGLKHVVDARDIPFLIQGLATAAYPRGFNYRRPCVANVQKCQHVLEANLNVQELAVYNLEMFTESQLNFWADTARREMKLKEIKDYQAQFPDEFREQTIVVDPGTEAELRITLGPTTIHDYLSKGKAAIDAIVATIESTIAKNEDVNQRRTEYEDRLRVVFGISYSHYVKRISNDRIVIEEPETLSTAIGDLTADEAVFDAYLAGVLKYIDQARVGMVAIPTFKCPACQADHSKLDPSSPFKDYIPLDAVTLFFDLLHFRRARLMSREIFKE